MIEAMKQALEALEEPKEHIYKHRRLEAITSLRQAIEQAENQAPVAWIYGNGDKHDVDFDPHEINELPIGTFLYTDPQPKREWVGLTDEEIALVCAECAASAHNWNDISFARAIEAKLKEKNT